MRYYLNSFSVKSAQILQLAIFLLKQNYNIVTVWINVVKTLDFILLPNYNQNTLDDVCENGGKYVEKTY